DIGVVIDLYKLIIRAVWTTKTKLTDDEWGVGSAAGSNKKKYRSRGYKDQEQCSCSLRVNKFLGEWMHFILLFLRSRAAVLFQVTADLDNRERGDVWANLAGEKASNWLCIIWLRKKMSIGFS